MNHHSKLGSRDACIRYIRFLQSSAPRGEVLQSALCRYICSIYSVEFIRTIIVVERPYHTEIYPEAFAAMSYDPALSDPTPATLGAATLVSGYSSLPVVDLERWFRDSWMALPCGVILLNVCYGGKFMEPTAQLEKLEFQRLLRGIILHNTENTRGACVVLAMGNPAKSVVTSTLSSLGVHRSRVTLKSMPNPAVLSHRSGDSASRKITAEYPGALRYLSSVISSTTSSPLYQPWTFESLIMSKTNLPSTAAGLAASLREIRQWLDKPTTLEPQTFADLLQSTADALDTFGREVTTFAVELKVANSKKPGKVGQGTSWGPRPGFGARSVTGGTSSQISVSNPPSAAKSLGGFADEDSPQEEVTPVTPTPQRRLPVPVTPSKTGGSVASGFADDSDAEGSAVSNSYTAPAAIAPQLRLVAAYISENSGNARNTYAAEFTSAAEGKPASKEVVSVSTLIASMTRDSPDSVSTALGYDTGEIDTSSELVKVLKKMLL